MDFKLTYSLTETDYLNFQLFTASQSKNVRNSRKRNIMLICAIFIAMAIFDFVFTDRLLTPIIFLVLALCFYFFYPLRQKVVYINHYKKYIKENYQYNFDKENQVIFHNNDVTLLDAKSEYKIQYDLLEEINELPFAYYLKLKSSQSVIIPKGKSESELELKDLLVRISTKFNIKINEFPYWKWK